MNRSSISGILALAGVLTAQTGAAQSRGDLLVGPIAGVTFSKRAGRDVNPDINKTRTGYAAGAFLQYGPVATWRWSRRFFTSGRVRRPPVRLTFSWALWRFQCLSCSGSRPRRVAE